jgi:hypothetical protein
MGAVGGCFVLLVLTGNAAWAIAVMWVLSIPIGVTGMLVGDRAPSQPRNRLARMLWPPALPWAPVFRRHLWPALLAGLFLAGLVFLAHVASKSSDPIWPNVEGAMMMTSLAAVQLLYLLLCSRVFRDDSDMPDGRPRQIIVFTITFGIWGLAVILPLTVAVAVRQQPDFGFFAVLIAPALLCLGVMCRGLQAWNAHPAVRHDVSAFAIQSGVVVFILWVVLAAEAILRSVGIPEPGLVPEILRTLIYAATFLLLPAAWWTLHVIRFART